MFVSSLCIHMGRRGFGLLDNVGSHAHTDARGRKWYRHHMQFVASGVGTAVQHSSVGFVLCACVRVVV